jgi:hypothetical protein
MGKTPFHQTAGSIKLSHIQILLSSVNNGTCIPARFADQCFRKYQELPTSAGGRKLSVTIRSFAKRDSKYTKSYKT